MAHKTHQTVKYPIMGDYPHNRVMVLAIQAWDGEESLAGWSALPGVTRTGTYERLRSHAVSVGLDVGIIPEGSRLFVTLNLILNG